MNWIVWRITPSEQAGPIARLVFFFGSIAMNIGWWCLLFWLAIKLLVWAIPLLKAACLT